MSVKGSGRSEAAGKGFSSSPQTGNTPVGKDSSNGKLAEPFPAASPTSLSPLPESFPEAWKGSSIREAAGQDTAKNSSIGGEAHFE